MNNNFLKVGFLMAISSLAFVACDKENGNYDGDMDKVI